MSAKHEATGKNYRARNKNDHDDFFPTYHALTRLYLEKEKFDINDTFLEPCAGAGDILRILHEFKYSLSVGFDIVPRHVDIENADFLKEKFMLFDHIITNPPFKLSIEFMEKASILAKKTISFLWPLDYLHGIERFNKIYKVGINGFFLDTVYPFIRRPLFSNKYRPDGPMPTGATSFAWFKFAKYKKRVRPIIDWLDNTKEMGVPISADAILFQDIK